MKSLFTFRLVSLMVCSALVAACGGGGGGGNPAPPPPPPPTTFTIGGTLTGLATGASVVLQNNGGSNLTASANGAFTFTAAVNSGAAYAVTVLTQPSGQTCTRCERKRNGVGERHQRRGYLRHDTAGDGHDRRYGERSRGER